MDEANDRPTDDSNQDPTSWDLQEGSEIVPGRFALRRLGGGHDYEAYLAWDEAMLALVVAKCLRPHLLGDERALRSFRREAEMLTRLNHPVVVRGFDVAIDGERPHVLMEYLEAPHLSRLIRRFGPLSLEQLLPLTLQICSALHYMHSNEIVHLDIKPRNVIMTSPPRVIDLSVARSFDAARKLTGRIGTDAYMAPEQCDPGRATVGPPADVWGLGATLYHAATGSLPFPRPDYERERDQNNERVRFPQLFEDPRPFPKGFSEALAGPIRACLQPDPGARPSVRETIETIEPLVASLPTKPVLRRVRPGR